MYKEGHFGLGLLTTSPFALIALELGHPLWALFVALGGIGGALIPDIDNKPIVPFSHHGWTHTVIFGVLTSSVVAGGLTLGYLSLVGIASSTPLQIEPLTTVATVGMAILFYVASVIGFLSHLFGDALSTAGGTLLIRPWKPVSNNYVRFGVTTAGNPVYNHTFFVSGVLAYGALMYVYI